MDLLKVRSLFAVVGISAVIGVSGCSDRSDRHQVFDDETVEAAGVINPENWPKYDPVFSRSYELEVEINALLEQMTLEEKVGQILQADISSVHDEASTLSQSPACLWRNYRALLLISSMIKPVLSTCGKTLGVRLPGA